MRDPSIAIFAARAYFARRSCFGLATPGGAVYSSMYRHVTGGCAVWRDDCWCCIATDTVAVFVSCPLKRVSSPMYSAMVVTGAEKVRDVSFKFWKESFLWYESARNVASGVCTCDTFDDAMDYARDAYAKSAEYAAWVDAERDMDTAGLTVPYGYAGLVELVPLFVSAINEVADVYGFLFFDGDCIAVLENGACVVLGEGMRYPLFRLYVAPSVVTAVELQDRELVALEKCSSDEVMMNACALAVQTLAGK